MPGPLTWRQVTAPDFRGTMDGQRIAATSLERAFTGLSEGLGKFQEFRQGQAENAALTAIQGFADPTEARAALAAGLPGVDRSLLTPEAFGRLNSQVGTLLTQAGTAEANRHATTNNPIIERRGQQVITHADQMQPLLMDQSRAASGASRAAAGASGAAAASSRAHTATTEALRPGQVALGEANVQRVTLGNTDLQVAAADRLTDRTEGRAAEALVAEAGRLGQTVPEIQNNILATNPSAQALAAANRVFLGNPGGVPGGAGTPGASGSAPRASSSPSSPNPLAQPAGGTADIPDGPAAPHIRMAQELALAGSSNPYVGGARNTTAAAEASELSKNTVYTGVAPRRLMEAVQSVIDQAPRGTVVTPREARMIVESHGAPENNWWFNNGIDMNNGRSQDIVNRLQEFRSQAGDAASHTRAATQLTELQVRATSAATDLRELESRPASRPASASNLQEARQRADTANRRLEAAVALRGSTYPLPTLPERRQEPPVPPPTAGARASAAALPNTPVTRAAAADAFAQQGRDRRAAREEQERNAGARAIAAEAERRATITRAAEERARRSAEWRDRPR